MTTSSNEKSKTKTDWLPRSVRNILLASLFVGLIYALAVELKCGNGIRDGYCAEVASFATYYQTNLRASFFTGFLTLSGFLMSLKTFIIVNMKKEVYDGDEYEKVWKASNRLSQVDSPRYEPLAQLANVLYGAIVSCATTAILQLTLGLWESLVAALVCVLAVAVSIIYLWQVLSRIRANLNMMFEYLNEKSK